MVLVKSRRWSSQDAMTLGQSVMLKVSPTVATSAAMVLIVFPVGGELTGFAR